MRVLAYHAKEKHVVASCTSSTGDITLTLHLVKELALDVRLQDFNSHTRLRDLDEGDFGSAQSGLSDLFRQS